MFDDEVKNKIKEYISKDKARLYIGVDTGATNTRVALGNEKEFFELTRFKCKSARELINNLKKVADNLEELGCLKYIRAGCLGAAGRVTEEGKSVEITNFVDEEGNECHKNLHVTELPHSLFPLERSQILNDLEIASYGIAALHESKTIHHHFEHFAGPVPDDNKSLQFQHYLVAAVGTGLGIALMMAIPRQHHKHIVLPLECGHVLFPPSAWNDPRRSEESSMIEFISQELYQGKYMLEYEDIVSGRGVEILYKWVTKDHSDATKLSDASEISKAAAEGNEDAKKALFYHYLYLARCSANTAVALQARGIFWAGGNQVTNKDFVHRHKDELYKEFMSHPKPEWLESIPIYMQTNNFEINLEGAFNVCRLFLDSKDDE